MVDGGKRVRVWGEKSQNTLSPRAEAPHVICGEWDTALSYGNFQCVEKEEEEEEEGKGEVKKKEGIKETSGDVSDGEYK